MKNIGEFLTAALTKLLMSTCGIPARREMRIGAFRPRNAQYVPNEGEYYSDVAAAAPAE